jgi:hypothetical protein
MGDEPERYLLKNISTSDVNIGDLRYRIPAGQTRNLLSKTAHLEWEHISQSKESGSIAKRLGRTLIEVEGIVVAKPPHMTVAKPKVVDFPQRTKSYITIDVVDIAEAEELARSEDDEFLREMENEGFHEEKLPIIAGDEEEEDDGETKT